MMKPVVTLVLLLVCLDLLPAAIVPGHVSFEFGVEQLAELYGTNAAAVQQDISRQMAEKLAARFRYWDFQADLATNYPRLEARIQRNTSWIISLGLVPALGVPEDGNWETDLFGPGELAAEGFPPKEVLPARIVKRFESVLLVAKESLIHSTLQKYIPLVPAVHPPEAVPLPTNQVTQAVLPLAWSRYQTLCISLFRIECRKQPGGALVSIYSQGRGQCSEYPPDSSFRGLAVEHQRWGLDGVSAHLNELPLTSSLRIYLERYDFVGEMNCEDSLPESVPRISP
jgi:hypothetical protein